jgi:hypothetical protein
VGGGQSGLPLWGSFAREGATGGGRQGRGRVAGSLVAPPWLKPYIDARVGSGGGCQGARGDPAPGQIGRRRPTLINLHGLGGGQGRKAAQLGHCSGEPPHTTSLYRGNI